MARGLSTVNWANKVLDHMLRAVASSAPAGQFVKLFIGDPGASGTANPSSVTTRPAATFAAASGGACSLTGTAPSWPSWAGTNGEVVTDIGVFDANAAGNFMFSVQLAAPKTVNTGDTLTLATLSVSLAPLAA